MTNFDKRILDELRRECLEIEKEGVHDLADEKSDIPDEVKKLFDSVIPFATDDEIAQIDAFFQLEQSTAEIPAGRDKRIKGLIKQECNVRGRAQQRGWISGLELRLRPAVAFRSSDKGTDQRTLKAIADFARELEEED